MFIPVADMSRVPAMPENLVSVIESINTPNVVLPGQDAEPTQAFIAGMRNDDASFSIYIYLLQTQSMRPAIYACDPRSIPLAQYPEIESEALQFVESMGFMLDNLNFRRQTPDDQQAIFKRLSCFKKSEELQAAKKAQEAPLAQNNLEGLAELEELEPLETLSPISGLSSLDDDLPLVSASIEENGAAPASVDTLLSPRAKQSSAIGSKAVHELTLDPDERQKLAKLLAAF